jgi:hypothetical protein
MLRHGRSVGRAAPLRARTFGAIPGRCTRHLIDDKYDHYMLAKVNRPPQPKSSATGFLPYLRVLPSSTGDGTRLGLHRRHGGDMQPRKQPREPDGQHPDRHQQHADGLAERLTMAPELLSEDHHRQRSHDRHVHHSDSD